MEINKRTLWLTAAFMGVGLVYLGATELFDLGPNEEAEAPSAQESQQGEGGDAGEEAEAPAADPAEREALQETGTIVGEGFRATVDNLGGGVHELFLTGDERFEADGEPVNMRAATPREDFAALQTHFERLGVPDDVVWDLEQVSPSEVRLSWEGDGLRIVRTLSAGEGPYQIEQTIEVTNTGERDRRTQLGISVFHYVERASESGGFLGFGSRSPKISSGVCVFGEETERIARDALAPDDEPPIPHGYGNGDAHLAAVEDVYFVQAVASQGGPAQRCSLWGKNLPNNAAAQGTLLEARLVYPWQTIEAGQTETWRTLGYLGPKIPAALEAAGHQLPEVVDLGFFALIASQLARLLGFIQQFVPNWGLAIILLTLMIRLVLFPLTNLSFKSMARMRRLKPEMDRINELYKDNAEKKGAAIMELYRKQKINPLSGCLPMVLQLPIWWALYTSLSTNIELYHMPFALWWTDLSSPDPYFVLPLALGALMHLQQRLTPTTMDPAQAKMMMWFMPIMITVFMLFLPSGLCLYMLTNSALGIGQQKLNEWRLSREPAPEAAAPVSQTDEDDGGDDDSSSSNEPRRPKRKRIRRTRRG